MPRTSFLWMLSLMLFAVISAPAMAGGDRLSVLVKQLTGRKESVRISALQEAQRDVQTKYALLSEFCQAARLIDQQFEPDDEPAASTVALLSTIASIERPAAIELLIDFLGSKNSRIVIIAVDLLGERKHHEAIDALAELRKHSAYETSYGFRFNLMRSLARMKHPKAIEVLTRWRSSLDGQLRFELERLLAEVTLEDFRDDQERFSRWQQSYDSSARPQTDSTSIDDTKPQPVESDKKSSSSNLKLVSASQSSPSSNGLRLSRETQFYGIDINAKRVMFIIDHSGSMKQYFRGLTRLERAKTELIRVINKLPADYSFAITFYETKVRLWRDKLVLASDENKRLAIQFIKSLGYGNDTNTHGALRSAIEFDEELEAVYLLSDGVPTSGDILAPSMIVQDIMHRNRFRHLQFNTIGVAVSSKTELFLRKLAELSGAEFRLAN